VLPRPPPNPPLARARALPARAVPGDEADALRVPALWWERAALAPHGLRAGRGEIVLAEVPSRVDLRAAPGDQVRMVRRSVTPAPGPSRRGGAPFLPGDVLLLRLR